MISVEMLRAQYGDALWIEYGRREAPFRILVDGGFRSTYQEIARRLDRLEGRQLELWILTHVDEDHIKGAVPLAADARLRRESVGDVWFNGWRHLDPSRGPMEGEFFSALLLKRKLSWNRSEPWCGSAVVVPDEGPLPSVELEGGLRLTLLSPTRRGLDLLREEWRQKVTAAGIDPGDADAVLAALADRHDMAPEWGPETERGLPPAEFEEDRSPTNGSSIAVLAEFGGRTLLLAGDAHPSVIAGSVARLLEERRLDRLQLDALKVAHHGSSHNTSPDLVSLIRCREFLFSTNGKRFKPPHPHEECIRRLIGAGDGNATLRFNYRSEAIVPWVSPSLQQQLGFSALCPGGGGEKLVLET